LFLGYEGLDDLIYRYYTKLNRFSSLPAIVKKPLTSLAYLLDPDRPDNLYNAAEGENFIGHLHTYLVKKPKKIIPNHRI